jgi:hypothetical protein
VYIDNDIYITYIEVYSKRAIRKTNGAFNPPASHAVDIGRMIYGREHRNAGCTVRNSSS